MGKKIRSGSGMNNPDHNFYPGAGMEKIGIRDVYPGSRRVGLDWLVFGFVWVWIWLDCDHACFNGLTYVGIHFGLAVVLGFSFV